MKKSISHLQDLASKQGGKCLSKKYLGKEAQYEWLCKNNHTWWASYKSVRDGSWCRVCKREKNKTFKKNKVTTDKYYPSKAQNESERINFLKKLAEEKNGKFLSEKYINSRTKYKWQCREGHVWDTTYGSIKNGTWCPVCSGNKTKTIAELKNYAMNKKGKCLSKEYINNREKYHWQCENGHTWWASYGNVKSARWCPKCSGLKRKTIDYLQHLVKAKNGKCLSEKYINSFTKYKWRCEKGHVWWGLSNIFSVNSI